MKKIAIIGASYLQLPLVRKAKEMGIETHCFAWEEGAVCKDIADYFYAVSIIEKEQILEFCQKIKIDGIVSIASDSAVITISYIAEKMGLIANSYLDSLITSDKYLMRQCFIDNSILSPRFVLANEGYSINNFNFPLIVKPTDRSGSRGVKKVDKINELNVVVDRAKNESFTNQAIIEEYIAGSEVSVETISWQGKHFVLAITDKVTTDEPYFVEIEHHQPSHLGGEILERVKLETVKALSALKIDYGASHAEFKITSEGKIYIIEVGARMGGDFIGSNLVPLSTGYDFLKGVIDISLGYFEAPKLIKNNYSGVYFLSKENERVLHFIQNTNNYKEIVESEITDTELHSVKSSADRSGYFIYQSDKRFNI